MKIALMYYGCMNTFFILNEKYNMIHKILDNLKLDYDVYIHTDINNYYKRDKGLYKINDYIYGEKIAEIGDIGAKDNCYYITEHNEDQLREKISKIFDSKLKELKINKDRECRDNNRADIYKIILEFFLKKKLVFESAKNGNYDIYILMRPDVYLTGKDLKKNLYNLLRKLNNKTNVAYIRKIRIDKNYFLVKNDICISNKFVMDINVKIYDLILQSGSFDNLYPYKIYFDDKKKTWKSYVDKNCKYIKMYKTDKGLLNVTKWPENKITINFLKHKIKMERIPFATFVLR